MSARVGTPDRSAGGVARPDASGAPTSTTGSLCQACHGSDVDIFFTAEGVPVHNTLLLASRDEALDFPRGDLRLGSCSRCGFVQNTAFDAASMHYGPGYEDSQAHSPRFMTFATDLAQSLIDRYDIRDGAVVEIGSGKGDFLELVCRLGHNHGIGYDPADDMREGPPYVEHRAELFTAQTPVDRLDLLVCRHTLEHVPDVSAFATMFGHHLRRHPDAVGYLEVPDTLRVLREGAFWDLYYEHCSYFTQLSLTGLLERQGLRVVRNQIGFEGQYLQVEIRRGSQSSAAMSPSGGTVVGEEVDKFVGQMSALCDRWRTAIDRWAVSGQRVVLWGGGSKAVAFITTLGIGDNIAGVVDINPRKHGRFLPGCGHQVLAPAALESEPPDVVIVMNPIYLREVREDLFTRGLTPEVLAA